jgi:hypothetical protein
MARSQYSTNTSNYEFSTAPRSSYPQPVPVRFYLNHFRSSTVDYVLDETGWASITEFEDKARQYDMFTTFIAPNGFLTSSQPQVDKDCFRVFEFSLHHLKRDVLDRLMYYYIGMNQTDYELQYPEYNAIYLAVPYYSWLCGTEKGDSCGWQQSQTCCEKAWQEEDVYEDESDSETDVSDEECKYPLKSRPLSADSVLFGWKFHFNTDTNNSYVLQPPSPVTKVSGGQVYWGGSKCVPTTWKLQMKGLERPLYYNAKYGGWIVSLSLGDTLLQYGATLKK